MKAYAAPEARNDFFLANKEMLDDIVSGFFEIISGGGVSYRMTTASILGFVEKGLCREGFLEDLYREIRSCRYRQDPQDSLHLLCHLIFSTDPNSTVFLKNVARWGNQYPRKTRKMAKIVLKIRRILDKQHSRQPG